MGFFSKKNNDIGFIVNTDDETPNISGEQNLAPHAITADEVSNLWVFGDIDDESYTNNSNNALEALKKRMNILVDETQSSNNSVTSSPTQQEKTEPVESVVPKTTPEATVEKKNFETPDTKTLLEKLHRYTVDEQGHDLAKTNEPLYKLESVAEILKSDSEDTIKKLSKKYDIFIDDLGKGKQKNTPPVEEKTSDGNDDITFDFKQMVTDSQKREEEQLYENLFEGEYKETQDEEPVIPIIDIPDISDIDNREFASESIKPITDTATIRFTPVKDTKGNTDHITISSVTKHIDLGDVAPEIEQPSVSTELEESEFEKFEPSQEITDIASGKKILRSIALKKRSAFLGVFVSAIAVIALLVFLIPTVSNFLISNPKSSMFICVAFLLVSVIANVDMFFDFAKLFKKKCTANIMSATLSVFVLALTVCAALTNSNAYYTILLCASILLIRAFTNFKYNSAMHGNLKQILNENQKNAVTLIDDKATTFAMAKNSIEGDVLVCAHKKATFIQDFMKYSTFKTSFSNKFPLLFYFSTAIAILGGLVAYFYYDNNIYNAFYCSACILALASVPTLFFIDSLPLSITAKKLNSKGAMIAGLHGAEIIENANAAVISTNDIFPNGTVKMYSMKVLSNNNIDETILKAASLTAALNSPLEAIFKQIAGTNSSYSIPSSDTVKYEKRLGISGWVDNELLFIGNRSLMEAHGIAIPSVEIDKKILRRGYFPVYVATENTACALIVIKYEVRNDIAKQLRKITELGITLLVDNCDPNINEEMLCDYFGLYEDSVKIMTNAGVYMYKNATPSADSCSAPAVFSGSALNFVKIINCASNIKKSNLILTVMYILSAVLGVMYFIYAAFSGLQAMPLTLTLLIYESIVTVLSIIGFLIRKP